MESVIVILGAIAVGLAAVAARRANRLSGELRALRQAHDASDVRMAQSLADGRSAEAELAEARARAERYFRCVADIERERNEWRSLYHSTQAGNAAAQSWLLRDLSRVVTVANVRAKEHGEAPLTIDPALSSLLSELSDPAPAPAPAAIPEQTGPGSDVR